jgi:chemotaxis protein histidine kinase CheA
MTEAELKAKADTEAAEKAKADAARADAEPAWAKNLSAKCDAVMDVFKNDAARADKMRADAEEKEKEEKAKADKARADAEAEEKAKADKARADAEAEAAAKPAETAADKAKADAEAEEKAKADKMRADAEAEAKADSAKRDLEFKDMQDRLAALTGAVHISDADRVALAEIQARADGVANAFGDRAPGPLAGETPVNYRRRLAAKFKPHSSDWKDRDLSVVPDSMLDVAEKAIYADAERVAAHPADIAPGTLREIVKHDRTGRRISEFVGSPSAWMDQFKSPAQLQVRINKEFN